MFQRPPPPVLLVARPLPLPAGAPGRAGPQRSPSWQSLAWWQRRLEQLVFLRPVSLLLRLLPCTPICGREGKRPPSPVTGSRVAPIPALPATTPPSHRALCPFSSPTGRVSGSLAVPFPWRNRLEDGGSAEVSPVPRCSLKGLGWGRRGSLLVSALCTLCGSAGRSF